MANSINQFYIAFIFFVSGLIIGILFDLFRIKRKSFKTSDIFTYIEDLLFAISTGVFLLFIIFKYSYGQIRLYMIVSLILGLIIYLQTISKYFIRLNVKIITIFKTIFIKFFSILLCPLKFIWKILRKTIFRPFSFITINIRKLLKSLTKFPKYVNIWKKNRKNLEHKKDFTA